MSPSNRQKVTNAALKPKCLISDCVDDKRRSLISARLPRSIRHNQSVPQSNYLRLLLCILGMSRVLLTLGRRLLTDSAVRGEEGLTDPPSHERGFNDGRDVWDEGRATDFILHTPNTAPVVHQGSFILVLGRTSEQHHLNQNIGDVS